jgi:hypothetical protein
LLLFAAACGPDPEVVAVLSAEYDFAVDSSGIYVVEWGTAFHIDPDTLERTTLASGLPRTGGIALDDDHLYVVENSIAGDLVAVPKTGGDPVVVKEEVAAHDLVVDDQAVYLQTTGFTLEFGLWRLAHGATEAERLHSFDGTEESPFGLQQDDDELLFCGDDGRCLALPKEGGEPRELLRAERMDAWVILPDDTIYYTARSREGVPSDQIWRARPGAAPELVGETDTDATDDDLFANAYRGMTASPDGEVYVATGRRILRIAGDVDNVIEADVDWHLQLDPDHVYWRSGERILRTPR